MSADNMPREASPPVRSRPRRRRWRFRLIGALVLLLLAGGLAGDFLLAGALAFSARRATGWRVTVDRVRARLFPSRVRVENVVIANPVGFPEGPAIVVREVYVEHGGRSERPRETLLRELRVDIARVSIIRRADGVTNMDRLVAGLPEPPAPPPVSPVPRAGTGTPAPPSSPPPHPTAETAFGEAPGRRNDSGRPARPRSDQGGPSGVVTHPARPSSPPRTWRVERMTVTIGAMEWKDESAAKTVPSSHIELNRTYTFTNVTDMAEIGDRLAAALLFSATPKLLEEALAPLWE